MGEGGGRGGVCVCERRLMSPEAGWGAFLHEKGIRVSDDDWRIE
jgi:hypothetical protein